MPCPFCSPFIRVHILGSHARQSCVAISRMEMSTQSLAWLAFAWSRVPHALELIQEPRHSLLSPSARTQLPRLWQPVCSSFLLPEVEECISAPIAHYPSDLLGPLYSDTPQSDISGV